MLTVLMPVIHQSWYVLTKTADIYRNCQHLSMPERLPAAGKEVILNSLSLFKPDYILQDLSYICIAL